jgi:cobalt-zinc-cadmium efflux system outer membrane protein
VFPNNKKILISTFYFLFALMPMQGEEMAPCDLNLSSSTYLDLDTAVYRALAHSLSLYIAKDEMHSRGYLVKQARLYPNPGFSYEVENFAGNNNWKGWNKREERYIYSQLFETSGKRRLRTQAASYQYYASVVGYDVSKLIVLNRLSRAFIHVAAAQELLKVTLDQAEITHEVLRIAAKKVETGKVSLIQQNKAEVTYSTALIAVEKAKVELKNSKRRLSLLWAQPCPDFEKAVFSFYDITSPIPFEQCLADLCNQAEIVQSLYQYLNAKKSWHLEKAHRIPDVTLQVGYKANYEEFNQGMIAGISIPIPIFNRNQGNIGRAYFDMLKTGDQGRQLWLVLESKLAISYEELFRAYEEAERTKNISLPAASQAFELAQKGYLEGKFEYLEVLDAQRTLFDIRERYIQALVNYHTKRADIDYLNSQMD